MIPEFCLENDVDYKGNDLHESCKQQPESWIAFEPIECVDLCKSVKDCTHFTWQSPDREKEKLRNRCCLKSSDSVEIQNSKKESLDKGVISGVIEKCEGKEASIMVNYII